MLKLDSTPTGAEEYRDFNDPLRARGLPYKEGEAKTRIDTLARMLALFWTIFLMYIVIAQGNRDGVRVTAYGYTIPIVPKFNLGREEFIAVFTTTTASVFGFLVIVANHLFKKDRNE